MDTRTRNAGTVVYLAGPMSGYPDHNFSAFDAAQHQWEAYGYTVVSPANLTRELRAMLHPDTIAKWTWEQYLAYDLCIMQKYNVERIVLLRDWQRSKGARLEVAYGLEQGFKFYLASAAEVPSDVIRAELQSTRPVEPIGLHADHLAVEHDEASNLAAIDVLLAPTETICQEADRLVDGSRQADYGHPLDNYTHLANVLNATWKTTLTPEQVALGMIQVKIVRELNKPKRDNRVDISGYAKVCDMIVEEAKRRGSAV